ncbi:peptidase [Labilibaculum sp. A4]|uniref:Peptidase n=1 Tax=Labilibaculum euxinus TaxID=2686357 RepID=A0A425YF99_9BACT|nr:RimK/LysX family protein [Labilibaculum euxinus]MDQ1770569.1 RimK/LysX family protein [Labilibaculum euxinus]MUP39353.1 peptidase [Labilibaculum euxinus]MVB08558.1 peptidase [Labilibaculum euxinus]MWN75212.1 peptidase [Labilibaculum euxinus]
MKIIIGKIDRADFPDLHLSNIDLKVDTGAYTSSIHCHQIEECQVGNERHLKFKLLDPSHPDYNEKEFTVKNYKKKRVKNSFGKSETRFVIETIIILFDKEFLIELSLSERSEMRYPILIGRKLLNGKFIVDTSKRNISFKLKQKNQQ